MRGSEPGELITCKQGAGAVVVVYGDEKTHSEAVGWVLQVHFGDPELDLIARGGARRGGEPFVAVGAERRVARFIVATSAIGGEHILTFRIEAPSAGVLVVVAVEENFDTIIL